MKRGIRSKSDGYAATLVFGGKPIVTVSMADRKMKTPKSMIPTTRTKAPGSSSGNKSEDVLKVKTLLKETLSSVMSDFLNYNKKLLPPSGIVRLKEMCEYTILGGKMYRAMLVINTVSIYAKSTKMKEAMLVAWCVEILQAAFLTADDIMDRSITRRGKACWYKQAETEGAAINDSLLLESFVYWILKRHFKSRPMLYIALTDLFREVTYLTELGQMLDISCETEKNFSKFTKNMYHRICHNKTAMYTFYLPIAAGLLIAKEGEVSDKTLNICSEICSQLGLKFQIQDDYLDCYGDSKVMGKVGTDIRDHKCTWLLLQALQLVNPSELSMLQELYGNTEEEGSEKKVTALYTKLGLPDLYAREQEESFTACYKRINEVASIIPPAVFLPVLYKMQGRSK